MKERKKNLFVKYGFICWLTAVFLLKGSLCVCGEETVEIGIDRAFTQNEKLYVYVNHNRNVDFSATADNSELLLDNQVYEIESIQTLEEADVPVSYLFLVDVSGSMDEQRIETAKSMIHQFLDKKKEGDNFCIVTMGDNLNSSGFFDSAEEISAWTDKIALTKEDTNLYYSITEELKVLKTEQAVRSKRCLVILSDGADDQAVGITREEAETAVKDAHIPVFTVALLKEEPTESQIESAKILGSFSRYSAGGRYYAPVLEEYETGDICGDALSVINRSLIVTADLNQVDIEDKNAALQMTLSDGSQKAEDEVTIFIDAKEPDQGFSGNLAIRKEKTQEEDTEDSTQAVESEEVQSTETEGKENVDGSKRIITGVAVGAVLFLALLIILVLTQKKKKPQHEENREEEDNRAAGESEKTALFQDTNVLPEQNTGDVSRALKVALYQMGQGKTKEYTFSLKSEVSMGRGRNCTFSMPEDKALSETHCIFKNCDGKVFLMDNGSTNGTFVNGVPIVGEHELYQDDVLLAGSYEYRVTWR